MNYPCACPLTKAVLLESEQYALILCFMPAGKGCMLGVGTSWRGVNLLCMCEERCCAADLPTPEIADSIVAGPK